MPNHKIVWIKVYQPNQPRELQFVWKPERLDRIWGNKLHDIEWKYSVPVKDRRLGLTINDSAEELEELEFGE